MLIPKVLLKTNVDLSLLYPRCLTISPNFEIAKNNMAIALTDLGTKVWSCYLLFQPNQHIASCGVLRVNHNGCHHLPIILAVMRDRLELRLVLI